MDFRIADTFTDSLARLTGDEQKAVKTTAFDLQLDPAQPGLKFHRLDKSRDRNFWSVRVNSDVRLIVHRSSTSLLLCYVDHHDKAYAWAERRKLETHPKTGAAQLVEIRETVQEVVVPTFVSAPVTRPAKPLLFERMTDDELLGFGVPPEWLADVRRADEDSVLGLVEHLPAEAAEALLELAVGGTPRPRQPVAAAIDPLDHPDAQRRFRVVANVEELTLAFEYPWERWIVFLHPAQRELVERRFGGPARVSGSAGTGKTIVALHRAVHLARAHPEARVLLTTFSETLASALRSRLRRLAGTEPRLRERLDVESIDAVARRLFEKLHGPAAIASPEVVHGLVRDAARAHPEHQFSLPFLLAEWGEVVDAWQLDSWSAYRDVARLGRKTRLPEKQRQTLWGIYEPVRAELSQRGLVTQAGVYARLAAHFASGHRSPYDHVVVDEAQDVSVPQLRFLAALAAGRPDALFFAGDLGQRIFQTPFSWKSLGVDIRGRSSTLRINYRTSHQIRAQSDRLLGREIADVDGNVETRGGTISVFNGPDPEVRSFADAAAEAAAVAAWMKQRAADGFAPHEIALVVRSDAQLERAQQAAAAAGVSFQTLDAAVDTKGGHVALATMHLVKGLEFRAVAVMACDEDVLPLQSRLQAISDPGDLENAYDTERHLLYVACTRARDHLLVTGVKPTSEFLDDLVWTQPPA